jgi:glycosyltransferase involved in cell wall biosynthesis
MVRPDVRIVALLTVRNEARVLDRCLRHLADQGIEICVVDNDSVDDSRSIAESFRGHGVIRVERLPYPGSFELATILRNEERLAAEIDADWFIHHDADEIREAPEPFPSLAAGLAEVDRQGFNAVHFDEFVFLPSGDDESYEGTDFVARMEHYYFFEPGPLRRVNAWKRIPGVTPNLTDSGGHSVEFPGRKVFPTPFVMRHYIALSRAHVVAKYGSRVYSNAEVVERKWHGPRAAFDPSRVRLPPRTRLKRKDPGRPWDRSDPWLRHEFFGDERS